MLALQRIPKISEREKKQLVISFGSAVLVFSRKDSNTSSDQAALLRIIDKHSDANLFRAVDSEILAMQQFKIRAAAFYEDQYPKLLLHCYDGPLLLFYRGAIDLTNPRIISIVGTRKMTLYGKEFCEDLIDQLRPYNPIIVSGLAFGVDITAHKAAIKNGLQTIACLAHGLNTIHPTLHSVYKSGIEQNGGFVSEFWTNEPYKTFHFLQRNRIIAGMSKATIVIESAKKGGSLVTADIAFSYDRDLFAVPGRIYDKQSRGCNDLIKQQKAQLLTSGQDLVKALNWDLEPKPIARQTQLFVPLSKTEQSLIDVLENGEKIQLDDLAIKAKISLPIAAANLLSLELKNLVRPLPGKHFMAR